MKNSGTNNIMSWVFPLIVFIIFLLVSCNDSNDHSPEPDEQLSFTFGVSDDGDAVVGCSLEVIAPTYINNKAVTNRWYKDGNLLPYVNSRYYSPTSTGGYSVIVSAQGFESKTSDIIMISENDWTLLLRGTKWRKIDNENVWIQFEDAEINMSPRMGWNYAGQSVYFGETLSSRWGNQWGNTITTKSHITFNAIVANDILTVSNWTGSFYGENVMNGIYIKQ